jgi:hypothetical protein
LVSWYRTAIGGHHDRRAEDHPRQGWLGLLELAKQLGNAKRDGTSGVNTLKVAVRLSNTQVSRR